MKELLRSPVVAALILAVGLLLAVPDQITVHHAGAISHDGNVDVGLRGNVDVGVGYASPAPTIDVNLRVADGVRLHHGGCSWNPDGEHKDGGWWGLGGRIEHYHRGIDLNVPDSLNLRVPDRLSITHDTAMHFWTGMPGR